MKICIISFDHWHYDSHISKALEKKGIQSYHINTGNFKYFYSNFFQRIFNFFQKLIFNRNIKKIKQYEFIINELKKIGSQDKILVINPDLIPLSIHYQIKQFTPNYIAYLYDSSKRYKIDHLLENVFDTIFSFDDEDVKKFGFIPLSNYIYHDKKKLKTKEKFQFSVFIILSIDERLEFLNKISLALDNMEISYKFILVGSKKPTSLNPNITFQKNILSLVEVNHYLEKSEIFLDLVRNNQTGLSFRVFESLAYQKKLITTNKFIKNYSFYNPNNILVIDNINFEFNPDFFRTSYEPLSEEIYNFYTIENWVLRIFNL